jgi:hypothetical protein
MRNVTELMGRSFRRRRVTSSRVFALATLFAGRVARGDETDDFFMADHMYDEQK